MKRTKSKIIFSFCADSKVSSAGQRESSLAADVEEDRVSADSQYDNLKSNSEYHSEDKLMSAQTRLVYTQSVDSSHFAANEKRLTED